MSLRTVLPTVLALVLSTFGLTAADASSDRDSSRPPAAKLGIPRTYDDAVDHFQEANGDLLKLRRFVTPSGNIYCAIKVKHMPKGCEINEGAVKDPDACGDNPVSKYVGRIEFRGGHARPICNTDTIRQPGAKTLAYGDSARFRKAKIACLSESIGVTCIHLQKTEGFFLHKGEYVIFNAG